MSTGSDKEEQVSLQHAAEHEKPHKKLSVMTYLVILIAAAFLLLLLSYFMQPCLLYTSPSPRDRG